MAEIPRGGAQLTTREQKYEKAKDAMQKILAQIARQDETGVSESLNSQDAGQAKSFFLRWKREHEEIKSWWFLIISISIMLFFPKIEVVIISVFAFLFIKYFNESETLKIKYIYEMAGDIMHIAQDKRSFYIEELKKALWGEKRKGAKNAVSTKFYIFSAIVLTPFIVFFVFNKIGVDVSLQIKQVTYTIIAFIMFFMQFANFKDE